MNRLFSQWWIRSFAVLCVLMAAQADAQDTSEKTVLTLINGAAIDGRVVEVMEDGIKVQVGRASKTFPWYALSAGTRFNYDPSYRMNIDGYLAGADPSTLTNAPDPNHDPMNPESSTAVVAPVGVSANQTFDAAAFSPPDEIIPSGVPALSVISLDGVEFNALQYGASSRNVLLSGFTSDNPPDLILCDLDQPRLMRETAAGRSIAGEDYYAYPRKMLSAEAGDISIEQGVQWLVDKNRTSRRYVHVEVDVSRGSQQSSFVLSGRPRGFESADSTLPTRTLLTEPAMSFTIIVEDEKTYLIGKVRMGRLSLVPRSGMDLQMKLVITDATGRSLVNESVSFNPDVSPGDYPVKWDISRFDAGGQYKIFASMSLGALLGELSHEELFIMPDAMKL